MIAAILRSLESLIVKDQQNHNIITILFKIKFHFEIKFLTNSEQPIDNGRSAILPLVQIKTMITSENYISDEGLKSPSMKSFSLIKWKPY